MSAIYYPKDYENNYGILEREISDIIVSFFIQMNIFHTVSVNHISVIGIHYCFDKGYNQVELNAKMGHDNGNPYSIELAWYINNDEVPIDEVLPLLANQSKFIIYNLDVFSRRIIDVREIRSCND